MWRDFILHRCQWAALTPRYSCVNVPQGFFVITVRDLPHLVITGPVIIRLFTFFRPSWRSHRGSVCTHRSVYAFVHTAQLVTGVSYRCECDTGVRNRHSVTYPVPGGHRKRVTCTWCILVIVVSRTDISFGVSALTWGLSSRGLSSRGGVITGIPSDILITSKSNIAITTITIVYLDSHNQGEGISLISQSIFN